MWRQRLQARYLYKTFGMRIIGDMLPTARKAREIEGGMRSARMQLGRLSEEYKELAMK